MSTKTELKRQINKLASEYLGFETELAGLSKYNKKQLEEKVSTLKTCVRFKKYADKIEVDTLTGYFAPLHSKTRNDYNRKALILRVANELWFFTPYEKAKQKARQYMGS